MNKNFMILAASAVMLASCSNDETVDLVKGDAIQFRTAVNSRGAVLDNSTLRKFVVSAYDSGGKTYFSNAVFSGYSSNFTSDNDYCWPVNGGTLDFTAYAPVGLKDVITTPTGVTINGFTPPHSNKGSCRSHHCNRIGILCDEWNIGCRSFIQTPSRTNRG